MARRSSSRFQLKHYLVIFFALVVSLGLVVTLYAAQQPTNTQSDAAGCTAKPRWAREGSDPGKYSVDYHLRLINNCRGENDFIVEVTKFPTEPNQYYSWSWKFANGDWNTPHRKRNVSGGANATLTIARPEEGGKPDTQMVEGLYRYFVVKAALANNPSVDDTISLTYQVENP